MHPFFLNAVRLATREFSLNSLNSDSPIDRVHEELNMLRFP